jgi:hypothetical protein
MTTIGRPHRGVPEFRNVIKKPANLKWLGLSSNLIVLTLPWTLLVDWCSIFIEETDAEADQGEHSLRT